MFKKLSSLLFTLTLSSNAYSLTPQTTYAELPCLSDSEWAELKKIDFKSLPGANCGDESAREKMGKLIKALPELVIFSATPSSNLKVTQALGDPKNFLLSRLQSIGLNENQVVESHKWRGRGAVEIAPHFFLFSPFEAAFDLLSLFVDAEKTPEYQRCHTGKYTMTNACAREFSSGENAGASSSKILLLLRYAKYAKNPEVAKLARAMTSRVAMERVYRMPANEGATIDLLYALDAEGSVHRVDPFTKKLDRVVTPDLSTKFTRLKHDRKSGGLLLFTADGNLWRMHSVSERFEEIKLPFPVKDYEPSTSYLLDGITPRHFPIDLMVDTSNRAWLISQIGANAGAKPWPAKEHQLPFNLKSLANCWIAADCMLDDQGYQWSFYYLFSGLQKYDRHQNMDNLPWRQLSGGFFYDEIWGVNEAGKLFYRDGYAYEDLKFDEAFQSKSASTYKYIEASSFRALVDRENQLFLSRDYVRRVDSAWPGTKGMRTWKMQSATNALIVDVDRTLAVRINADFIVQSSVGFAKECALVQAVISPWSGKSVGLTADGVLVFEGNGESRCNRVMGANPNSNSGNFMAGSTIAVEVDTKERLRHPEAALVITSPAGERSFLVPYNN